MAEEGEGSEKKVDWSRGPKTDVDITNVDARKLQKAHKERGIVANITESVPGKVKADITKVVVEDMPAPKKRKGS